MVVKVAVGISGVSPDTAVVARVLGDWPEARRRHSSSSSGAVVVDLRSSSATGCRLSSSGAVVVQLRSSSATATGRHRSSRRSVPEGRSRGRHGSLPMKKRVYRNGAAYAKRGTLSAASGRSISSRSGLGRRTLMVHLHLLVVLRSRRLRRCRRHL